MIDRPLTLDWETINWLTKRVRELEAELRRCNPILAAAQARAAELANEDRELLGAAIAAAMQDPAVLGRIRAALDAMKGRH